MRAPPGASICGTKEAGTNALFKTDGLDSECTVNGCNLIRRDIEVTSTSPLLGPKFPLLKPDGRKSSRASDFQLMSLMISYCVLIFPFLENS